MMSDSKSRDSKSLLLLLMLLMLLLLLLPPPPPPPLPKKDLRRLVGEERASTALSRVWIKPANKDVGCGGGVGDDIDDDDDDDDDDDADDTLTHSIAEKERSTWEVMHQGLLPAAACVSAT